MIILAIDPGKTESGYALIDSETCKPFQVGKIANDEVLDLIHSGPYDRLAIEMVQSFGMAVGAHIFETCVWIGRFVQQHAIVRRGWSTNGEPAQLVYRDWIKRHHCHAPGAKDSNVSQALRDRFAPGVPNYGKGSKAEPGWFYGFSKDAWQAYALAVYVADAEVARVKVEIEPAS